MNEIQRNIGENRGKRRVWIEGKSLTDGGWVKGVTYSREETADGFVLTRKENGPLKIAGGENRPVIDMCGGYVAKVLDGYEKVSVKIEANKITITGANAAAMFLALAA